MENRKHRSVRHLVCSVTSRTSFFLTTSWRCSGFGVLDKSIRHSTVPCPNNWPSQGRIVDVKGGTLFTLGSPQFHFHLLFCRWTFSERRRGGFFKQFWLRWYKNHVEFYRGAHSARQCACEGRKEFFVHPAAARSFKSNSPYWTTWGYWAMNSSTLSTYCWTLSMMKVCWCSAFIMRWVLPDHHHNDKTKRTDDKKRRSSRAPARLSMTQHKIFSFSSSALVSRLPLFSLLLNFSTYIHT